MQGGVGWHGGGEVQVGGDGQTGTHGGGDVGGTITAGTIRSSSVSKMGRKVDEYVVLKYMANLRTGMRDRINTAGAARR